MQDLITDFYKRFNRESGRAYTVFCPCTSVMFGADDNDGIIPVLGLKLNFGVYAAYRKRSDGRICIAETDTNVIAKFNIKDTNQKAYPKWAKSIFDSMMRLPADICGMDIIFGSDTEKTDIAHKRLCAVMAMSSAIDRCFSVGVMLHAANAPAYLAASLLMTPYRSAIINTATYDYVPYEFKMGKNKIILAQIQARRINEQFDREYQKRERDRLNAAAAAIRNKDMEEFGMLMNEASCDMLKSHKRRKMQILYQSCVKVCQAVRIMPNYCGVCAIVPDEAVEKFLQIVNSEYEKKAGDKPTFYISD